MKIGRFDPTKFEATSPNPSGKKGRVFTPGWEAHYQKPAKKRRS